MKKVFAILAVAGFMAACNNGDNKDVKTDSPKAAMDTTKKDTGKMSMDTMKAKMDTSKPKM
jgi:hypothetical protein